MSTESDEPTFARYRRLLTSGPSVERTVAFSDGVFAIALTLLVLEVRVPDATPHGLAATLVDMLPSYLTFVLSFLVIGMLWMSHHRKFSVIVAHDQTLLRLNLLALLFVATLPFPTALLGRYGDQPLAATVYAACIAFTGLALVGTWLYAWRRGLVDAAVTPALARFVLLQSAVMPLVFLASIPVAWLWGATAGELAWITVAPILLITRTLMNRHHPKGGQ